MESGDVAGRWRSRRVSAMAVRLAVVAVPVAVGFGVAILFASVVSRPSHGFAVVAWWVGSLAFSSLAFAVVWRQAQRALPLATLLKWSLVFPDRTPSRFRAALRAGSTRNLERRVAELHVTHTDVLAEHTLETVLALAAALNAHDRLTRGHSERVRAITELIAAQLGVDGDDRDRLRWASLLHDCGKLSVDPHILGKPGPLDDDEWLEMRRHPEEGAHFAEPLRAWLGEWVNAIEQHHEKWDGSGYPKGLAGKDIALGARIVAVADAYDVMTSHRTYRRPQTPASAKAELARSAGGHFDPDIVRAFLGVSTGYLAWLLFPVAWLAQLPMHLSGASTAAVRGIRTAGQTATAAGAGALAVAAGVAFGFAPVSSSGSHAASTHVASPPSATAAPPEIAPPGDAPVAANVAAPAAGAVRAVAVTPGTPTPAATKPAASPLTAPAKPATKPTTRTYLIRLSACVDPVRVVVEVIPGVNISPTHAC